jgi:hypothetical protein
MAQYKVELPNDLIKQFEGIEKNAEKMMGEMTNAGAKVVYNLVLSNMKGSFKSTKGLAECLKITRVYKTPSDDGINTKVAFYGYFENSQGKVVPAPLVANAREYGTSRGEKKKPFFRKSFNKAQIESAMLQVQNKYLPKE